MNNDLKNSYPATDDMAALKQQIAELKKSEAYFRAITHNASDIIFVVNRKGIITYANPSVKRFLGYKPEELIGKSGFTIIIPSDVPRAAMDFGKSLLTRETEILNSFGIRHKDGSIRILEGVGVNLLHDPVVKGFVMNVRDVTDRRKAEQELNTYRKHLENIVARRTAEITEINVQLSKELAERREVEKALKESEEKYRDFIDNAPIGVGIIDMSGKVQYINKRIEELMGWKREEIIGTDGFGLSSFNEDTRFRLIKRFSERIEGDKHRLTEIPIVRKNDAPLWVEVFTTILKKDNVPVGVQAVFVNISERKQAEEALQKSEERFRTMIQQSSDVIVILDKQGRFIYSTPSAKTVFGYSDEEILGKTPLDFAHKDDHEEINKKFQVLLNKTNSGRFLEFRVLKRDGTWCYIEAIGNNLLDYPGINGIVLTIRNITERKKAEDERKAIMERLHRAEKMESLGTLAGGVAHDLNNVLGVLVGYTELLLSDMDDADPLKTYLFSIMKSSVKATAIIQDLLTLARRGVPISEIINLNQVIEDYFQTPEFDRLKFYHPHIKFRQDLDSNLLNVSGSPVHLEKTVMNLISNAVEAITDQGEVTVSTHNCYIGHSDSVIHDVSEGDYVLLKILDNGQGIPAKDLDKIFEPFYTKKVMGRSGTGLGLAVVWGTVKDHKGYIDVQSEPGKGSAFTLYFPATREAAKIHRHTAAIDSYMGAGESILVVDDVQEQREVASNMLARLHYQVTAVSSGEEAVAYFERHAVDLVFLDMLMDPGIDGLETYKQILKINPRQKAILVSGYSETERVKEALKLGASAYVHKPYILEDIGTAIRKALAATAQE